MSRDVCGVYTALEEHVKEVAKDWDFERWYRDGIDCYLSREVVYLCLEWNDPGETGVSFEPYSDYELAIMAWWYPQEMDDFTRLWNDEDLKREVLKECLEWIRNAYPDREGLREKIYGQPQEDHK